MDFVIFIKTATAAQAIASYFGLIDSVSGDVKKLLHKSFNSAIENLNYALNNDGDLQRHYMLKALDDFIL